MEKFPTPESETRKILRERSKAKFTKTLMTIILGIEALSFLGLGTACLFSRKTKSTTKSTTKLVHEYFDLNENGKYDTHRLVFETGEHRDIRAITHYTNREFTREELQSISYGNEIRFLGE